MDSCIPREEEEEEGFRSKHSCEYVISSIVKTMTLTEKPNDSVKLKKDFFPLRN
jgi:hypothetical protein